VLRNTTLLTSLFSLFQIHPCGSGAEKCEDENCQERSKCRWGKKLEKNEGGGERVSQNVRKPEKNR